MAKAPQKSKDAKAKAASGGGKKSKKKWSKGKVRDKLANMCLFDKPTYEKVVKEVPNYKVCQRKKTTSSLLLIKQVFPILSRTLKLASHNLR